MMFKHCPSTRKSHALSTTCGFAGTKCIFKSSIKEGRPQHVCFVVLLSKCWTTCCMSFSLFIRWRQKATLLGLLRECLALATLRIIWRDPPCQKALLSSRPASQKGKIVSIVDARNISISNAAASVLIPGLNANWSRESYRNSFGEMLLLSISPNNFWST